MSEQIDPVEGAWVENALRHAAHDLAEELDVEVDAQLCEIAGVPSRGDALAIWSGLSKRVWHSMLERVWSAAADELRGGARDLCEERVGEPAGGAAVATENPVC